MSTTDIESITAALHENHDAPYSDARSARAEQLVDLATQSGDRPVLILALQELIEAYDYNGESDKILVPFARVMRLWDENPQDFDRSATYGFHWHFKWVSGGMLALPQIPLQTIRSWRADMEKRYRTSGYGLNAVRKVDFDIAEFIGDHAAAEAALAAWQATDRDEMSDCRACDLRDHGSWLAGASRDDEALTVWRPVLEGEQVCSEEPHHVLARSLLPLLRLGRLDEARANHLRGYRLARRNSNLLSAVARHLEFCALTGNEARGLEILTEHRGFLGRDLSVHDRLAFEGGLAVLLRRLVALGLSAEPVPDADGRETTVGALLARVEPSVLAIARSFDDRNGTGYVSQQLRARLEREPLVASLPLGIRTAALTAAAPIAAETKQADPAAALAEARALTASGHPRAHAAWLHAQDLADLDELAAAEFTASAGDEAIESDPNAAREHFLDAAARFTALSVDGEAARCRAQAAIALVISGDTAAGLAEAQAVYDDALALHAAGRATAVEVIAVGRARAHAIVRSMDGEPPAELALLLDDLVAFGTTNGAEGKLAGVLALRGQLAVVNGDNDAAVADLERSTSGYLALERPWGAAHALAVLARLRLERDEFAAAAQAARDALAHGASFLDAEETGSIWLTAAQACFGDGDGSGGASAALEAAHWFDAAQMPAAATHARFMLGNAYRSLGRFAEAATILDHLLPQLEDDEQLAQARHTLGTCLVELDEHRDAAEQFLLVADIAKGWENQTSHALSASDAAHALVSADLLEEAGEAFDRAIGLWRSLGRVGALIRTMRARAELAYYRQQDLPRAVELFQAAAATLREAAAAETEPADCDVPLETAETFLQHARVLLDDLEENEHADEQAAAMRVLRLAELGANTAIGSEDAVQQRVTGHRLAAHVEANLLGRSADAVTRLDGLLRELPDGEDAAPFAETVRRQRAALQT